MEIEIAGKSVGVGHPCFVIAEIGQAHDGSLGMAHSYIDAIAVSGADAVKFQTHIAAAESTAAEAFRVKFSTQDATRYDYWRRMEFTPEQWEGLAEHARRVGLVFLSSPFSSQAVQLLEKIDCPAWKVGSGEVTSLPLLKQMVATGKPVLLSSGMSSWSDLDKAVSCVCSGDGGFALFQCTTAYPCPPERWGLNIIHELRERFGCPVGYSDHSGGIYAGLAAVALGANLVEVHVVFSKECFGPDVSSSITTVELKQLVKGVREIEAARINPVEKNIEAEQSAELRLLFGKSLVAAMDLPVGTILKQSDLAFKKPGTGIPAADFEQIVDCRLVCPVAYDEMIKKTDIISI